MDDDCFKSILMEDFNNLTNKVTKLETEFNKLKKENYSLKINVNKLESVIEKISSHLNLNLTTIGLGDSNKKNTIDTVKGSNEEETWLYYVKTGEKKDKIRKALDLSTETPFIEFNTLVWGDENKMLINILQNFKKFQEFSEDWASMTNKQLKHYVKAIVSSTLINDVVFLLKGLPSKKLSNYDQLLALICTFTGIIFNTCEEMEKNDESIGKFALIIESEEELQILNSMNKNTRMLLFVEQLFK